MAPMATELGATALVEKPWANDSCPGAVELEPNATDSAPVAELLRPNAKPKFEALEPEPKASELLPETEAPTPAMDVTAREPTPSEPTLLMVPVPMFRVRPEAMVMPLFPFNVIPA